jgi:hypothetical protein
MNVTVKCIASRCNTDFVSSFDSVLQRTACCPVCNNTWSVHMTDLDGNTIHPTETCPTCSKPALLSMRCRCSRYCIRCANGHQWHTCSVHKTQVTGDGHRHPSGCSCEVENP